MGIVGHTEDLLRDQTQIKATIDEGLVIFCWGDDNNSAENIRLLKSLGLHAIIYDKMDVLSTKEKRVSWKEEWLFSGGGLFLIPLLFFLIDNNGFCTGRMMEAAAPVTVTSVGIVCKPRSLISIKVALTRACFRFIYHG